MHQGRRDPCQGAAAELCRACAALFRRIRTSQQSPRIANRSQPLLAIFLQAPAQQFVHANRRGGDVRLLVQDAAENLHGRFACEQSLASQHFINNHAKRPDVGALVRRLALGLLGSHVRRRPENGARLRRADGQRRRVLRIAVARRRRFHGFRQAEIQNLDDAFRGDLDVGRLQVAMDDVLLVRGFDAVDQLLDDGERIIEVQRTAQVLTLDILHDQIVRSDVVQMADVGVVERGDRAGLAGEALGELGVGNFDRDIPIQPGIVRAIHLAHAALADGRKDFIRAEFVADGERHVLDLA